MKIVKVKKIKNHKDLVDWYLLKRLRQVRKELITATNPETIARLKRIQYTLEMVNTREGD